MPPAGASYLWGRQALLEALRAGHELKKLCVAHGAKPSGALAELLDLARRQDIPIAKVAAEHLDRLAQGANHQGVVAEAADYRYVELEDLLVAEPRGRYLLLLVLDHINDPQNFGTLLRSSEAVGVDGVIIPRERAVGVTGAVVKSSAGAVEHLRIAQVVNLPRALDQLKDRGVWVVGLDALGRQRYDEVDYAMPVALVVGSEGRGLSRLAREKCDLLVKLPMRGKVASLNAAVAGSIALYEILRRRELDTK